MPTQAWVWHPGEYKDKGEKSSRFVVYGKRRFFAALRMTILIGLALVVGIFWISLFEFECGPIEF
jgi:hypothetical protein